MQAKYQPYRGARDFYPIDFHLRDYIFKTWSHVVEGYGYERYDAPVLEYLEIYQLKSQANLEILNEQVYTFVDRGQRHVALRPEMTPSLARMIAARRQELSYPLRWYSIPNIWRYERPQKGRLREHWQLNVDCFGLTGVEAELEIILIACDILKKFGAQSGMYTVKLNSRSLLETIFRDYLHLSRVQSESLFLLFDRYDKMGKVAFREACLQLLAPDATLRRREFARLQVLIDCNDLSKMPQAIQALPQCKDLKKIFSDLKAAQVFNAVLDFKVVRGFDYYTGIVFEIFDQKTENKRSMFGGGRYDNLLQAFGAEPLSGIGFGMGDVTLADFLQAHHLLPEFKNKIDLYVVLFEDASYVEAWPILKTLRAENLKTVVDNRPIKVAKKIETALKKGIDHVLFVGAADLKEEIFNLKHLPSGQESKLSLARVISKLAEIRQT